MTASTAYRTPSQGKSFPYGTVIIVCLAIILLGITVRWLTANIGTTSSVTATTVTMEATAVAKALMDGTTTQNLYSLVSAYVVAYNPPPTTEALNESLERLTERINDFTKKKWMKVNKHKCSGRASWGLVAGDKKTKEVLHFEWDSQHAPGEIEVYTPGTKKIHLGSINFGEQPNKPAIKKRIATCECN